MSFALQHGTGEQGPPLLGSDFCSLDGALPVPVTPRGLEARDLVRAKIAGGEYVMEDKPCLCGARDDRLVATVDRYRIPNATVMCRQCGLVRTNPRLSPDANVDFYIHHYRDIYERFDHDPETYYAAQLRLGRQRADFILRRCRSIRRTASVLEVGCAGGWNLLPFHERGWNASGWDFDDDYLATGRKRGLDLRLGSLENAVAEGRKYELVILSHVLEHLQDPVADLRKLQCLLTPSGVLYVEVPSLFGIGGNLLRYFQSAHMYSFVPETLRHLMESAGFRSLVVTSQIQSLWVLGAPERKSPRLGTDLPTRTERFLRTMERDCVLRTRLRGMGVRVERLWLNRPGQAMHDLL